MRKRLVAYIRKHALMRPGDRVGVAVSGGADSVALLRLLLELRAELGIVLSVVHFNHKIRGAEAEADERFVRELARGLQLEFHCDSFDTPAHARFRELSLEAAARELRYSYFRRLLRQPRAAAAMLMAGEAPGPTNEDGATNRRPANHGLDRVATAHTRDDQAETVLLRLLRGAGTRGLAGIHPQLSHGAIVRPLLEVTREELRDYLRQAGQSWREDASNRDVSFTRNRVRHELLPVLTRDYNPALAEVLSDAAEIARAEEEYWQEQVRAISPKLLTQSGINLLLLQAQPLAVQRRLVRAVAEQHGLRLEFRHVEEVLALTRSRASAVQHTTELPQGWEAVRRQRELRLQRRCQKQEKPEYDCALAVPGEVEAAGRNLRARLVSGDECTRAKAWVEDVPCAGEGARATHVLLNPELAQRRLRVRNWRPGDRYWPAHTSAAKKLKELLQAKHIPRERKPSWPVVITDAGNVPAASLASQERQGGSNRTKSFEGSNAEEIVWVPGFAAPERFRVREGDSQALLLEEVPLEHSLANAP